MGPGESIHHYTIVSALGAGGMGEVYLADDRRLGRRVALKLLPQQFASDVDRVRRFEQEARAVSALNHPNILTLFELGRAGSEYFMATEFVEGRTLRAHLRERRRLPAGEAVGIAMQVASALAAAHASGIVHRDVKPENVMLRPDGYVKVLDFGLARFDDRTSPDSETAEMPDALTSAGVVLGTVDYLSPEQARGLRVDARTDIFSLGVVLYEMLTGARPFAGPTPSDVIAALLRSDPAPLRGLAPDVPREIETVVARALARDPERRYQSIRDFAADLARAGDDLSFRTRLAARPRQRRMLVAAASLAVALAAVGTTWSLWPDGAGRGAVGGQIAGIKSIAVLPFALIGSSAADEHLGLGLADALIGKLQSVHQLTVRPTNAVLRYQDARTDAAEAGRTLKVDAVLAGTVQRSGDRVVLNIELIPTPAEGGGQSAVWRETLSATANNILELQDQIAARFLQQLALQLSGEDERRLAKRPTENARAYALYVDSRIFLHKRTAAGMRESLARLEQAITLDGRFALAYLGQAIAWQSLGETGGAAAEEAYAKSRALLAKALELDASLGEAWAHKSFHSRVFDWQFAEAERESDRSVLLDPNNGMVLQWRGVHQLAFGRIEDGIDMHRRAVDIDPLNLALRSQLCRALFLGGRYQEAIDIGVALTQADQDLSAAHQYVGDSYSQLGNHREAVSRLERAVSLTPDHPERIAALGYGYARAGRIAEARRQITLLLGSNNGAGRSYYLATVYAGLADTTRTFEWLNRALDARDPSLANRVKIDPKLNALRRDERFQDLIRRSGFPN